MTKITLIAIMAITSLVACRSEPEPDVVIEYTHVDIANKLPGVESLPLSRTIPNKDRCVSKSQLGRVAIASNGTKYVCMGSGWRILEPGVNSIPGKA